MTSTDTLIARNPRVVYRKLGQEAGGVLLHLDTAAYHGLNPVGSVVWGALLRPMTFEALIAELRGRFDAVPPTFDDEIRGFVDDLVERDLLTVNGTPKG